MDKMKTSNIAFIDGQNLHLGTKESGWSIDHARFRIYLSRKYNVTEAYYFLGFVSKDEQDLYGNLKNAGFVLSFKEHAYNLKGLKKGNVDSDIIFEIMRKLIDNEPFDKVFIVSGDGDYKKLVAYLVKKERFGKMLFPNEEFASSLYNSLGTEFYDHLENDDVKAKIIYHHKQK